MKIYKIGSSGSVISIWILPNGRIIELTSNELHTSYVRQNPSNFNITDQLEDMYNEDIYSLAFSNGAVRAFTRTSGSVFYINCNRVSLSKNIEIIHSLYKKYAEPNADIVIDLVNDDGKSIVHKVLFNIEQLYNYASSVKIKKTAKGDISFLTNGRMAFDWAIKNLNLDLVEDEESGYSELYKERAEEYSAKYNDLIRNSGDIIIYRALLVSNNQKIDYSKIGTHWSFNKSCVGTYGAGRSQVEGDKVVILTGKVKVNDIDWEYGFTSFMYYGESQWECALESGSTVEIVAIDDKPIVPIIAKAFSSVKIYRIAKMKISLEEKNSIIDLVKRVKNGYTNWELGDLQLYQNNSKVIEQLLKDEVINWDNLVEDELDKEIRELRGLL